MSPSAVSSDIPYLFRIDSSSIAHFSRMLLVAAILTPIGGIDLLPLIVVNSHFSP